MHNFLFNPFLASSNCCHLLITFENSLESDQDRQTVNPALDPNSFTTLIMFLKDFFEKKVNLKNSADDNKSMKNYPASKEYLLIHF